MAHKDYRRTFPTATFENLRIFLYDGKRSKLNAAIV
jgi:hypothetical protein